MNKINFILLFILTIFIHACAQKQNIIKADKTVNLIDYNRLKTIRIDNKYGKIRYIEDNTTGINTIFDFVTLIQPPFIYKLATAIPLNKQSFQKDQVFLLTFDAKSVKSDLETGEAKVYWQFKQSAKQQDNILVTNSLTPNWHTYYVPFQAGMDISAENLALVIKFGFRPQEFLLKNIRFLAYPKGTKLSDLPKTKITYKGMEKDAKWRQKALKRIDSLRQTKFKIQFIYKNQPVNNTLIHLTLLRHDFDFGATISSKDVVNNTLAYQKLKEYFNICVFENDLKIRQWQQPKRRQMTLEAIDILNNDGIKVKGHVLIWPGFRYMPGKIKKNQDNPELVKKLITNHVRSILRQTKERIDIWDVVNEAYTNQDLQRITGSEKILYQGFKMTNNLQPKAKRFVNEYGIISKGGINRVKQQWYYDFIKRIDQNTGGLVDGIGIQSHIGNDLTPPERVLEILDYYGELNKEIAISEFTLDVKDTELRKQYTRDFMIAAFSHPKLTGFIFWGLLKNDKSKVDLFQQDGTPGAMGQAYLELTRNLWRTKINRKTDRQGVLNAKGFEGIYQYEINIDGQIHKGQLHLNKEKANFIININ